MRVPVPVALVALALLPAAASAADLSGSVGGVSDYRFRGVSRSGGDPAAQASLYVSGGAWSAGVFASTVDYRGGDAEIDLSAAWSHDLGLATLTLGGIGYFYPGASGAATGEAYGWLQRTLGPVELTLGAHYAPDQPNLATDNLYLFAFARAGIPATPFTIKAGIGRESGANAREAGAGGAKTDWQLGADWQLSALRFGVAYVGSDSHPTNASAGKILFSVSLRF
jgi:uncharacterized protein (TIGR02001 family)